MKELLVALAFSVSVINACGAATDDAESLRRVGTAQIGVPSAAYSNVLRVKHRQP